MARGGKAGTLFLHGEAGTRTEGALRSSAEEIEYEYEGEYEYEYDWEGSRQGVAG